jgi:uncharacterized protein (TIRG00374 family)
LRRFNLILLGIALIFFVWVLHEVGWATINHYLVQVGWGWPVLLFPYGLVNLLEAISWKYLLVNPPPHLSFWRLFWLRLGGESLNQLTPTASLGGEPFKAAALQRDGVALEAATASVVIHKGILVLSLALYIFVGLGMAPFLLPGVRQHLWALGLAALGLTVAGVAFVVVQLRRPCRGGLRLLDKIGWRPKFLDHHEAFFLGLDGAMSGFYRQYPGRALLAFTLFFLSWLLHAVEVYLMFRFVGHPISWELALCLDALAMLFTALGFFIPAAAGVQEGGNLLLALGFDLGLALGAAFSILRRLREAFWLGVGLIVVGRERE